MSLFDRIRALFAGTSRNGGTQDTAEVEMISCHDALRVVYEYLDGELAGVPRSQVEAHFDACERCYPHLRLERVFREALRRAARGQKAPPELKARLVQLLAEADAEG